MHESLAFSEERARRLDVQAARTAAKNHERAKELSTRAARRDDLPAHVDLVEPLIAGLAPTARLFLALVLYCVDRGFDAMQLSKEEIAKLIECSERMVRYAMVQLQEGGYLIVTAYSVPVEETKLGAPYMTRRRRQRRQAALAQGWKGLAARNVVVEPGTPGCYTRSRSKNIYTVGHAARALGFGVRRPVDKPVNRQSCIATVLPALSESGSGSSERSEVRTVEPVDLWTKQASTRGQTPSAQNGTPSADSAPDSSLRSSETEKESLRAVSSLRSSSPLRELTTAPPPASPRRARASTCVAANTNARITVDDGDADRRGIDGEGGGLARAAQADPTRRLRPDGGAASPPGGPEPEGCSGVLYAEPGAESVPPRSPRGSPAKDLEGTDRTEGSGAVPPQPEGPGPAEG